MLAAIDPTGGGATSNAQLITLNFQRAVQAVATLAAGSATPTVNAITASSLSGNAIIQSGSNTTMAVVNQSYNGISTNPNSLIFSATTGATVYGLASNINISSIITANVTGTTGALATNVVVTAISAGNIEPGMAVSSNTLLPWYITGQVSVTPASTPATVATTFSGTSGQNVITVASATSIVAGQYIANATGNTITGIPLGTYVGAFYSNGTAYAGNTTVPLKTFANVDVSLTANFSANAISFFPAGRTGSYSLSGGTTGSTGTVSSMIGYKFSTAQAATTTAYVNVVSFSTNSCVTALISNTEAGGWSVSSNSTVADSFSGANNTAGGALLDLYVQNTNKASYPYHKIAIRQNPSVAFANVTYATFNYIYFYHGAAASNGYSDATFSAFTGPSAIVNQRTTPTATSGFGYPLANTGDFPCLLAVTNNYMHIVSNSGVVSMGYRETATWEDSYSDNPPVYNYSVDTRTYTTSKNYPASSFMWARSISNTGTFNTAARYQYAYTAAAAAAQPNPVSGIQMNGATAASAIPGSSYAARQGYTSGPSAPLFYLSSHSDSATYMSFYPPGYDAANSVFVPSAYPVVMQLNRPGFYSAGGKANGIFKSLSAGNSTGMTLSYFYTANATYNISGTDYYPTLTGGGLDLFLVRKA
jgi:hypothetical protein